MTGPDAGSERPLPPEVARFGEWVPAGDPRADAAPDGAGRTSGRGAGRASGARAGRTSGRGTWRRWGARAGRGWGRRRQVRSSTRSYAPLVLRRPALRWSPRVTTGALLGGAIGATTALPLALDGVGPTSIAGWGALAAASTAVATWGGVHRLRLAAFGPEGARRRALEEEIWARHARAVPGGEVLDAPGQQRWRFSRALGAVERAVADVPPAERALLLREARTVAVGASRLLRDAPSLGQATFVVFPEARFGRLDLTGDDTAVAGAGAAYRRLLDDAEHQLHDLAEALAELSRARAAGATVGGPDVARLHALVSLAELDADPLTRGPEPAIQRAADRIRAEAAATREVEGS